MQAVKLTHVNLCDLLDWYTGHSFYVFPSERELSAYSKRTKQIFPGNQSPAGDLLDDLYRNIISPRPEKKVVAEAKRVAEAKNRKRR